MSRKLITLGAATTYTVKNRVDNLATILCLTDNTVVTLPPVGPANKGQRVRIINVAAAGAALMTVSPDAADGIYASTTGAAGGALVSLSGTDNKDAINTKATALKGDYLDVISDGVNGWFGHGIGVWASEG